MKTLHSSIAGLRPANLILARRIAFPLLLLGAGLVLIQPCFGVPFEFETTGSLVVGGESSDYFAPASAELYGPVSGAWTAIGSNTFQASYEGGTGNDLTLTLQ